MSRADLPQIFCRLFRSLLPIICAQGKMVSLVRKTIPVSQKILIFARENLFLLCDLRDTYAANSLLDEEGGKLGCSPPIFLCFFSPGGAAHEDLSPLRPTS